MISFFDWFKKNNMASRPWLMLGQGPSFSRHKEFPLLNSDFYTMGLGRTARERPVTVAHAVDFHVPGDIHNLLVNAEYVVMPWYPHVKFQRTEATLEDLIKDMPALKEMDQAGRLLWYNLSTTADHKMKPGSPRVDVVYFSSEPALRLLAMNGVKVVRTLGMDGGKELAPEFAKTMKPLKAGHHSYSLQDKELAKIVAQYNLDFQALV